MGPVDQLEKSLGQVEHELRHEMASSLGRVGEAIEQILLTMTELRERHAEAPLAGRIALAREHDGLLDKAYERLWALTVQREAMGLTDHRSVRAHFPLPAPLTPGRVPSQP